jgi:TRAP-type uncharacterized transport system fused permease subunit
MRLGAVLYIVPFMFVYSPALLIIGSWREVLMAMASAAIGVFCLAAGLQGWLRGRATAADRAMLIGAAALLIAPQPIANACGAALVAATYGLQLMRRTTGIVSARSPSLD